MRTKMVHVLDEGTDTLFIVVNFDDFDREERERLERIGWGPHKNLNLLVELSSNAAAAISTFKHPPYDLLERSRVMFKSHTTISVAEIIRDTPFEELPSELDVEGYEPKSLRRLKAE